MGPGRHRSPSPTPTSGSGRSGATWCCGGSTTPGSTLFVVWNQNRATQVGDPRFNGLKDVWGIWDDPMQNVLLVKVNYYLSR